MNLAEALAEIEKACQIESVSICGSSYMVGVTKMLDV